MIAEAFRRLQAGDAPGALEVAQRVLSHEPRNARAHLAAGIALRMAGRLDEAQAAFSRASDCDPRDHAAAYEAGIVHQLKGEAAPALQCFERSSALRPDFLAAHFAAALLQSELRQWEAAAQGFRRVLALLPGQAEAMLQLAVVLDRAGQHAQAEEAFVQAFATHPDRPPVVRAFGQYSVSRGNFRRAASLFAESMRMQPEDEALPMYLAQCELLLGRWSGGWAAYARRFPRIRFEQECAARGRPYRVPAAAELGGRTVALVAEQGLGDILFFLRWAPLLRSAGASLAFVGEPRLRGLLARSGLFETFPDSAHANAVPLLAGDLPSLFPEVDPLSLRSLDIPPLAERRAAWQSRLGALGEAPWIGVQWRAGTSRDAARFALSKEAPIEALFAALKGAPGTLLSLQRDVRPGELEAAARAAGRPVHDLAAMNADLEDVLAVTSILDRHVAVSSTTLHLAAAARAGADVLVPFPPEWRWRTEGDSPWFPGMRVHRQAVDGDWSAALAAAARGD